MDEGEVAAAPLRVWAFWLVALAHLLLAFCSGYFSMDYRLPLLLSECGVLSLVATMSSIHPIIRFLAWIIGLNILWIFASDGIFVVAFTGLATLSFIVLRRSGWHLSIVKVTEEESGNIPMFTIKRWLVFVVLFSLAVTLAKLLQPSGIGRFITIMLANLAIVLVTCYSTLGQRKLIIPGLIALLATMTVALVCMAAFQGELYFAAAFVVQALFLVGTFLVLRVLGVRLVRYASTPSNFKQQCGT